MVERMKDAEDRLLGELLDSPTLADDGFSKRVVHRIQRRLWLRRLTVPVAGTIGGVIAFKPLTGLVSLATNLSVLIPENFIATATGSIPQLHTLVLGAVLLGVCLLGLRLLEE
tara:strand:+ start:42126 stop:42464 length:339 start_codon:yes stop_codon:yes gene_type:complete